MKITKNTLIDILLLIKGVCGASGITAVVSDHKWIGTSILIIGAIADQSLIILRKQNTGDSANQDTQTKNEQ